MDKKKTLFEEEIKCAHCKKYIHITKTRKTTSPSVKAEYVDKITVEKSKQTRLK